MQAKLMANVQVENGHLKIAEALVVAICREDFTAVQLRLLLAIMNMTYRVGKTKSVISNDDLRYATDAKSYKVQQAVGDLIDRKVLFAQHLVNGERLLGIQKDYDLWLHKMGNAINSGYLLNSNNNLPVKALPKMGKTARRGNNATPPGRILTWMISELNVSLNLGAWRMEYSRMVKLYILALELAHEPREAVLAIRDHFDYLDNPSFRAKVTRPASYMLGSFKQWYKQLPSKPRSIREDEQAIGYRYRFNLNSKQWEVTREKIKPDNPGH